MDAVAVLDSGEGVVLVMNEGELVEAGIGEEGTGKLEKGEYLEEVSEDDVDIVVDEIVLVTDDEGLAAEVGELQDVGKDMEVRFDVVANDVDASQGFPYRFSGGAGIRGGMGGDKSP